LNGKRNKDLGITSDIENVTCSGKGRSSPQTCKNADAIATPQEMNLPLHMENDYINKQQTKPRKEKEHSAQSDKNSTSNRLIQIPMSLTLQHDSQIYNAVPIKTFIDTGAQTTVMTFDAAKRAGIAHLIDRRYSGHASGVAGVSCRVLGRIPANSVTFIVGEGNDVIDTSPSIAILEDRILEGDMVDMLLGLDVLEEWQAMLCLRDRALTVRNGRRKLEEREIVIPFVGSRRQTTVTVTRNHLLSKFGSSGTMKNASSRHNSDVSSKQQQQQLYGQKHNPFTRDSSLLKSELDALDERSKSRPNMHASFNLQKQHEDSLGQEMENDLVGDEDDSDSFYFESDEDYDDCDLSGV
jgi:hypothetical protein